MMRLGLLVTLDSIGTILDLATAWAHVLLLMGSFMESPPSFPYSHVVAKGAGVIETTVITDIMGLAVIRKGGMGDRDNLHSLIMEGGSEVTAVVVITTFYS